ncbi:EpsG family protein [Clostridium perfringens]|uniref:EpsG family protein n=1 Tax=Clostridium perfringens TaxID=1502 RepID=UPI003F905F85
MFLLVINFSIIGSLIYKKNIFFGKLMIILSLTLILIIVGLRDNIGMDYQGYVIIYNRVINLNFWQIFNSLELISIEPGFSFINLICFKIGIGYKGVFFLVELISLIYIYKGIMYWIEDKENIYLVILIYMALIFFPSMNGIRQYLAVSMFLYYSKYIVERKVWRFILSIILMSTIHLSSIFLIPFYFIYNIKFTKKKYIFYIIILFLLGLTIGSVLFDIIGNFNSKYSIYINLEGYNSSSYNLKYFNYFMIFDILIGYILISINKKCNKKEKISNTLFIIFVILKVSLGGYKLFLRFNNYFLIFSIFPLERILKYSNERNKTFIKISIFFYYIILYSYTIYTYYIRPDNLIIPYRSILGGGI